MRTSQEWYDSIKNDPEKILNWLKNQYHGEVTAAERIRSLILCYDPTIGPVRLDSWKAVVEGIAKEEELHATWVGELLRVRGVEPEKLVKDERYWNETVKQIVDWDTGCAVAAHAEKMRLERIEVICNDPETQADIREVFAKILIQERFHAKTFELYTTDDAMKRTLEGHLAGLNELGLKA
jgi:rubrerythrin